MTELMNPDASASGRVVVAFRHDGTRVSYHVPTRQDALKHHRATLGEQYDRFERQVVTGGIAMLWPQIGGVA